jgi:hypothetical protein
MPVVVPSLWSDADVGLTITVKPKQRQLQKS